MQMQKLALLSDFSTKRNIINGMDQEVYYKNEKLNSTRTCR
jgi:hypothetical protein